MNARDHLKTKSLLNRIVSYPSCPQAEDEVMVCTASGTALAGQYANVDTVTANPPGGLAAVKDSDPSHWKLQGIASVP